MTEEAREWHWKITVRKLLKLQVTNGTVEEEVLLEALGEAPEWAIEHHQLGPGDRGQKVWKYTPRVRVIDAVIYVYVDNYTHKRKEED